jgi:hypothetical protein
MWGTKPGACEGGSRSPELVPQDTKDERDTAGELTARVGVGSGPDESTVRRCTRSAPTSACKRRGKGCDRRVAAAEGAHQMTTRDLVGWRCSAGVAAPGGPCRQ